MKRFIPFFFVLIAMLPLIAPFIAKGYFDTHDGQWAIIRLTEMNRELQDLQIPPRWAGFLNHGYGYPLFLFTYPFPYFLAEIFHLLGFGFVDAVKAVFALSIIGSGITMYLFTGSFLATFFYLYAPYRIVNLFIRGSIGESLAFVWYPLLAWFGTRMVKEQNIQQMGLFAAVLGLLIITHNAAAVLFVPILGIYLLGVWLFEKKRTISSLIVVYGGFVLGFAAAAYFWLPALMEQQYTMLSTGVLQRFDRFVSLLELVTGLGGTRDFPLTIGIFHVIALIVALGVIFTNQHRKQRYVTTGLLIILLFLMTPFARVFWEFAPVFSSIDFAWRLLGVVTFIIAVIIGYGGKKQLAVQIVCALLLIGAVWQGMRLLPQNRTYFPDGYYESNDSTTTAFDELMPRTVVEKPRNIWKQKIVITQGVGIVAIEENRSQQLQFNVVMETEGRTEIQTLYFPGWRAFIDGAEVDIDIHPIRGTIQLNVPQGTHLVKLRFTNTPVRTIADWITVVSIGIIGILIFKKTIYETIRK